MITVQENVPLASLTTFQIGGPGRYVVQVSTEAEICEALEHARKNHLAFAILGGGSNVLASDAGFDGLIIRILGGKMRISGTELSVDAGCDLWQTIVQASQTGLGAWEKLAGIPGTVGGGVRGNACAFGIEIKDVVISVHALHCDTLEARTFLNAECEFTYRGSFFKTHPQWIILSVELRLTHIELEKSQESIQQTVAEREKRHLQNVRAAGSYFMNPLASEDVVRMFESEKATTARNGRVPAGWLIESAGMKGARQGGAVASLQHPNYLTNDNGATAADVQELARMIKEAVKAKFGIQLQEEAALLE